MDSLFIRATSLKTHPPGAERIKGSTARILPADSRGRGAPSSVLSSLGLGGGLRRRPQSRDSS